MSESVPYLACDYYLRSGALFDFLRIYGGRYTVEEISKELIEWNFQRFEWEEVSPVSMGV